MARCQVCQRSSEDITRGLGLCARCILADAPGVASLAAAAHARSRERFALPAVPPRDEQGVVCSQCVNACRLSPGRRGYCGVRVNDAGRLTGGDADSAAVSWYHDPLPTNCVADWVCPASGPAGYPTYTDTSGPERGYENLAVFYEACSFDCLFCQNWHFRAHSVTGPRRSVVELAAAADERTRCICFFGGDPTCQVEHALAAARLARAHRPGGVLRICWETNGSMTRPALEGMLQLSLDSGGCIKFDLKAWDERLHRALCGVSNRQTLKNFRYVATKIARRPDPPLLVASTLLVPSYIEAEQVSRIASFIAALDRDIPYSLLAFYPCFEMSDLPTTSRRQAEDCVEAATSAGLHRVRIGNVHLLR